MTVWWLTGRINWSQLRYVSHTDSNKRPLQVIHKKAGRGGKYPLGASDIVRQALQLINGYGRRRLDQREW